MAAPEIISLVSQPVKAVNAIKSAWNSFTHLNMGEGISSLTKLGGEILGGVAIGISSYMIYDVLRNKNLKNHQKILPTLGLGIAIALVVPATVAVIAGAAALVPPFMFVASVGATVRNTMQYLSERKERNNLRKEFIPPQILNDLIDKLSLKASEKDGIKTYAFAQEKIYEAYYDMRQRIITHPTLSLEKKKQLVEHMNKAIEAFSKDGNQGNTPSLDLVALLPSGIKTEFTGTEQKLNTLLSDYNQACKNINKLRVPSATLKLINAYKFTHEKVASQDLPAAVKQKIFSTLAQPKIKQDDIKLLYAQIGNHYLNMTAEQQLRAQDGAFMKYDLMPHLTSTQCTMVKNYCQAPRDFISTLLELKTEIASSSLMGQAKIQKILDDIIQHAKEHPNASTLPKDFSELETLLSAARFSNSALIAKINAHLIAHQNSVKTFDNLDVPLELRTRIIEFQRTSLNQHANLGYQFPAPHIDFDLERKNLVKRTINYAAAQRDKLLAKGDEAADPQEETLKTLAKVRHQATSKEHTKQLKADSREIKRNFNQRYANTFDVIGKRERLRFLETAVPRRVINIFLGLAIATLSLATSVAIPAMASPAAPVAAVATTVFGAVSGVLTALSVANSLKLTIEDVRSERKTEKPKEEVQTGIAPDIKHDRKAHAKLSTTLSKKLEKQLESVPPSASIPDSAITQKVDQPLFSGFKSEKGKSEGAQHERGSEKEAKLEKDKTSLPRIKK